MDYWGSRTSDGSQTAYALMAGHDARFYKAALQNTLLMRNCTHNGLLTGGPHYDAHRVPVCVHHTFSHIKSLATILDYADKQPVIKYTALPREQSYGVKQIDDLQTWLVARGKFRATVTGYDKEYKKTKNGHTTGGALSMLWHEATGPLLCASMNEYRIFEAGNQQSDTDPHAMTLTPRLELREGSKVYMNISDLSAKIGVDERSGDIVINTISKLVDKDQQDPSAGEVICRVSYRFTNDSVTLNFKCDKTISGLRIMVPVIASSNERMLTINDKTTHIVKQKASVKISSDAPLQISPTLNGRVFNYVPGFEAIPFFIEGGRGSINIKVI